MNVLQAVIHHKTYQLITICIVVALEVIIYGQSLGHQLVWDDINFVEEWQTPKNFPASTQLLLHGDLPELHKGLYRPLRSIYYGIAYYIYGNHLVGYRIQAISIMVIASLLVLGIIYKLTKNVALSLTSLLLFTLQPLHVEAIAWLTASFDIIGVVIALASILSYLQWFESNQKVWLGFSVALATLAYFSNEITLVLPGLITLHYYLFNAESVKKMLSKKPIALISSYALPLMCYLLIRFIFLDIGAREDYLFGSLFTSSLIMSVAAVKQLILILIPWPLTVNHQILPGINALFYHETYYFNLPDKPTILYPQVLASISILLLLARWWYLNHLKYPLISFLIGWHFLAVLPLMQIVPQSVIYGERYLFFATVATIPLYIILVDRFITQFIPNRFKNSLRMITIILVSTIFFFLSYNRIHDWMNAETLWQSTLDTGPRSVYALSNLAQYYYEHGDLDKTQTLLEEAEEIHPQHMIAVSNLGYLYTQKKQYDKALGLHERIYKLFPDYAPNVEKMAEAYKRKGENAESIKWYGEYRNLRPHDPLAQFKYALAFHTAFVLDQAEKQYVKAIEMDPNYALAYWNLGLIYIDFNRFEEAIDMFTKAGEINPEYPIEEKINQVNNWIDQNENNTSE